MGCVPIVLNTSISSVYRNLPVMVINDWSEVNDASLGQFEQKLNLHDNDVIQTDVIYAGYWNAKIAASKLDI